MRLPSATKLVRLSSAYASEMLPRTLTHLTAGPSHRCPQSSPCWPSNRCLAAAAGAPDASAGASRSAAKRRVAPAAPVKDSQAARLTPGGRSAQQPAVQERQQRSTRSSFTPDESARAGPKSPAASKGSSQHKAEQLTAASAGGGAFAIPAPIPLAEGDPYAGPVYPTYVPRNPGIKDGMWNPADAAIVRQAQQDADKVVLTAKNPDAKGEPSASCSRCQAHAKSRLLHAISVVPAWP